jgi:hypothetical protein
MLAQVGEPTRTTLELMRHTDIRLTTQVYADPTLLDTVGAVNQLPRLVSFTSGDEEVMQTA